MADLNADLLRERLLTSETQMERLLGLSAANQGALGEASDKLALAKFWLAGHPDDEALREAEAALDGATDILGGISEPTVSTPPGES
jgi:hypothetical protein